MNRRTARVCAWLLPLLAAGAMLNGCRSTGQTTSVRVEPGRYAQAFDEARDVLAACRFTLERVDARAGVITTQPKATSGLATPWDPDQSSLEDEWADLLNQHEREVRVTFVPAATPDQQADRTPEVDLRALDGAMEARFEVTVLRVSVPGHRIEPSVIGMSSRWRDPQMARRGVGSADRVPLRADDELAARMADELRRRLGGAP